MPGIRRTSSDCLEAAKQVLALYRSGQNLTLDQALERVNLNRNTFSRHRAQAEAMLSGSTLPAVALNEPVADEDGGEEDHATAEARAVVARVKDFIAQGMSKTEAIQHSGWGNGRYYYWLKKLENLAARPQQPHADPGTALSATVDRFGRQVESASVIIDALKHFGCTVPDLEQRLGMPVGEMEGYLRKGQVPVSIRWALGGLLAESKLGKNGTYVPKKDQVVGIIRIASNQMGLIETIVKHLGGHFTKEG